MQINPPPLHEIYQPGLSFGAIKETKYKEDIIFKVVKYKD